ncbi:MAG: CvpA family protein [Verrucomicrobiota bacterium]|jgi:uncharacterized membrane protein required for colicin V production
MIAASIASMALDKLPFNWFDVAVVAILLFGFFRGRKNGMSKEVLLVLQWVALVVVCGFGYALVAPALKNYTGCPKTLSCVGGYLLLAAGVTMIFAFLRQALMPKLTGSNVFGGNEYYLGLLSGTVRYGCIALFALALLNAPHYTTADIQAHRAYEKRWYGGDLYGGNYIPDVPTVQDSIFKKSLLGPYIASYLGPLLIQTGPSGSGFGTEPPPAMIKRPVVHIGN